MDSIEGFAFILVDAIHLLVLLLNANLADPANVILLDLLGFIVAAITSFWGVAYAFGARKYLKDFIVAVVFSVIVYFGFTQGLNINLPAGIFADLIGK